MGYQKKGSSPSVFFGYMELWFWRGGKSYHVHILDLHTKIIRCTHNKYNKTFRVSRIYIYTFHFVSYRVGHLGLNHDRGERLRMGTPFAAVCLATLLYAFVQSTFGG